MGAAAVVENNELTGIEARQSVCTFFVSGLCFGVEVATMREVLRAQTLTRVPLARSDARGLMNLRGQIVTAIDLAERLGLGALKKGVKSMNVIVHTDDGPISLLVDEIGDVVEVTTEEAEAPPPNLAAGVRELIRCVYKLKDGLLLLLDVERTVAT